MYFWTIGPPTFSVSVTTVSFNTVHSVYIHSDRGENNQLMLCLVAVQELLVQDRCFSFQITGKNIFAT